jgi:hypothetical protein
MACVNCFFSSEHQKLIKKSCFSIPRFENRLKSYKEKYLLEIGKLIQVEDCLCTKRTNNALYFQWTNEFMEYVKLNRANITIIFDLLLEIYDMYIRKSSKHASDLLWEQMNNLDIVENPEHPMDYCRLLFRGREKTVSLDEKNPMTYFHIPFSSRSLIGNQRFSITGQPMLYFSNSILNVEKELEKSLPELSIAAFLPNYSIFYNKKINDLKNNIFDILVKSLPGLFDAGGEINFHDTHISPNCNTVTKYIQRSILCEVLTFPVQVKNKFVEEYVLPQLFTTLLVENDYKGLLFPSTKNYDNLVDNHIYSSHEINTAFFVNYDTSDDYDMNLSNSFHCFLLDGSEKLKYQINDFLEIYTIFTDKTKASTENNNDFILPLVNTKSYIEYMSSAKLDAIPYFETTEGKIELEFFMKLAKRMITFIR